MLCLIFFLSFSSSPSESSVGYSRSNSQTCETYTTENYPSPQELAVYYLSQIGSTRSTTSAIQSAENALQLCKATLWDPLRIVNALLKRIIYMHPSSKEYINRKRNQHNPKNPKMDFKMGPTPEILLSSVSKYVPSEEQYLYIQLLNKYFTRETSAWEINCWMDEVKSETSAWKINRWMDAVEKAKSGSTRKMRAAIHHRPWRP